MAIFAAGAFTIIIAVIRLAVISSEVLEYYPTLPDITYYVSLMEVSWTRSSNASRKGTTKIEDDNADNFSLANYKPASTREVIVARRSSSINSRQELHAVPGTVTVKRDFTREDQGGDSW
ncbi:hypothetical protein ACHAO8_010482 [Botrytis cinerea]